MRNETARAEGLRLFRGVILIAVTAIIAMIVMFLMNPRLAGAAEEFVVLVNEANPVTSVKSGQLSSLFLKKLSQWGGGLPALPVDLGPDSPVRESFSRQIHRKRTAAVKAYWQQMIFSGRAVPPPEKASAREVVAFVNANRGGVGYVPTGTALVPGVKTVEVKP